MKGNIPVQMLDRAIRYCSTLFEAYINDREKFE